MPAESQDKSRIPFAESLNVTSLVDFAPGAIVSRTLLENEAGTITIFSFNAGQGLSEHTAPFDAFVHILEGAGEFRIGDKTVIARKDEILVMPANVAHAVKARERFKMLLTMLRPKVK